MHKKQFIDSSLKELLAANSPGIFVEVLWKAWSDVRSPVSIVHVLTVKDQ